MIDLSTDESNSTTTLILTGDVMIQSASQLRETLLEGISEATTLVINLEQVERIDLSTVQILCATHRALIKAGKSLLIEGAIPESVQETVADAGYGGCMGDTDSTGLWTKDRN
ncbi:MAG: STAS domain-containing protein [Magnetococcales bacterium]|nr:STAS domain-containing protein [Magnetococcales bacterium]